MTSYLRIDNKNIQELDPNTFRLAEKSLDVFTTFATHKLGNKLGLLRLDLHVQRITNGAKVLNIRPTLENHDLLKSCLKKFINRSYRQKIRIIQRSSGVLELFLEPYIPSWQEGDPICLKSFIAARELPEIKHTNFAVCTQARNTAEQAGAQEGLLVSNTGQVLEGAWSNVFWVDKNKKIHSTKLNVLPGITRQIISELAEIEFSTISLEALKQVEEVFISQSTTGITAVNKIDSTPIKVGKTSKAISDKLQSYILENLLAVEDI